MAKGKKSINMRAKRRGWRAGILTSKGQYLSQSTLADFGLEVMARGLPGGGAELRHVQKAANPNDPAMASARIPDDASADFSDQNIVKPPHDLELLLELLEKNTTHNACCETKAADYAYNGWQLRLRDGLKDEAVDESVLREARLEAEQFLTCINDSMKSMPDLIYDIALDYEALGICAFEVIRRFDGLISGLHYIPAHTVRVLQYHLRDDLTRAHYVQKRFQKTRYFVPFGRNVVFTDKLFDPQRAPVAKFPAFADRRNAIRLTGSYLARDRVDEMTSKLGDAATELVVITRGPNRRAMSYGTPAGLSAYVTMVGEIQAEAFNLEFFRSKGVPQYAVIFENVSHQEVPADEDGEWDESEAAEEAINEYFAKELENADRSVLIIHTADGGKVQFVKLSPETVSEEILNYGKATRESTRLAHRIPPAALGIVEAANLGSGREVSQLMRYRDHIVAPGQRIFAAVVNTIIRAGLLIPYFEFTFDPMPVDDEKSRRDHKLKEFEIGVITPNEYRMETKRLPFTSETEGPDDAGDALYIRNAQLTIVQSSGEFRTTGPGPSDAETLSTGANPKPVEPEVEA